MEQTMLSSGGKSLLGYAVSRLNPEIFSHPVWILFGQSEVSGSPSLVGNLMSAAKTLEQNDPSAACQLLLICAFYQNRSGEYQHAIVTTRQALSLAQQTHLGRETTWAIWGTCAIFVQQGDFEQATSHFVDLESALREQNEWVLAGFVDVLRQSFFQKGRRASHDELFKNTISTTLDWIHRWGSTAPPEAHVDVIPAEPVDSHTQDRHGGWHTLMLAIRGELKLQWTRSAAPATKGKLSFWGAILSSLQLYIQGKQVDTQDHIQPAETIVLLPPAHDEPPAAPTVNKKKDRTRVPSSKKSRRPKPAIDNISLTVHMLGTFRLTIGDAPVKIPSSRSLSLFKYLLIHHKQRIPREILMDKFWPDAEPETARNSLNVAIHSLRQQLRAVSDAPMIVFEAGAYGLAPSLQVWIDVDEFERAHKAGQRLEIQDQLTAAVAEYECAVSIYEGNFLEENPYEEWTVLDRERYRTVYLEILDRLSEIYFGQERYSACRSACQLILASDACREDAHCLLMRCYSRQGQYHLALRQHQICLEALQSELQVEPAPETTQLYNRIRRREQV